MRSNRDGSRQEKEKHPTAVSSVVVYSMGIIGQTIADQDDAIVRKMKELECIASTSRNLKGTFVRRLRQASGKAQAAGTELQQHKTAAYGVPERRRKERWRTHT
jgi:hypothetical protein